MKVLSLNFFKTIATENPAYKKARTLYFSQVFDQPEHIICERYDAIRLRACMAAANFGKASSPILIVQALIENLRGGDLSAAKIANDLAEMFCEHPPIISTEMTKALERASKTLMLCLSSNTDFISGTTIQRQINLPFSVFTFSDLLGVAKPSADFFTTVQLRVKQANGSYIHPNEMLHIGSHFVCDERGSKRAGMNSILVKSPKATMDAIDHLVKERSLA